MHNYAEYSYFYAHISAYPYGAKHYFFFGITAESRRTVFVTRNTRALARHVTRRRVKTIMEDTLMSNEKQRILDTLNKADTAILIKSADEAALFHKYFGSIKTDDDDYVDIPTFYATLGGEVGIFYHKHVRYPNDDFVEQLFERAMRSRTKPDTILFDGVRNGTLGGDSSKVNIGHLKLVSIYDVINAPTTTDNELLRSILTRVIRDKGTVLSLRTDTDEFYDVIRRIIKLGFNFANNKTVIGDIERDVMRLSVMAIHIGTSETLDPDIATLRAISGVPLNVLYYEPFDTDEDFLHRQDNYKNRRVISVRRFVQRVMYDVSV